MIGGGDLRTLNSIGSFMLDNVVTTLKLLNCLSSRVYSLM